MTRRIILYAFVGYVSSLSVRDESYAQTPLAHDRHLKSKPAEDAQKSAYLSLSPHSPQPIEMHLNHEQVLSLSQALRSKEAEQNTVFTCGSADKSVCEKSHFAYLYVLLKFLLSRSVT